MGRSQDHKHILSRAFSRVILGAVLAFTFSPLALANDDLRQRIESARAGYQLNVSGETVRAQQAVARFYEKTAYQPVWVGSASGTMVDQLLAVIERADQEGLDPQAYHYMALKGLRDALKPAKTSTRKSGTPASLSATAIDLDFLATDSFLTLAKHFASGRVDPVSLDTEWHISPDEAFVEETLASAISSGNVKDVLEKLLPQQPDYAVLRKALAKYRRINEEGGWSQIAAGPKLELGSSGDRVLQLKQRLAKTGDFLGGDTDTPIFDETLKSAVISFQGRTNLDADGVVGPRTLRELNKTVDERIAQIRVNMERWRWLPSKLGERHILVNIADFRLFVRENGKTISTKAVIVGRSYRRTPVFSGTMTYLVLNPWWEVPRRIAVQDKLPLFKKDPSSVSAQGYEILDGWGADARVLDPMSLDWPSYSASNFPFRLRQRPGEQNALGRVKLMLPNRFSVYLHDTPSRELFSKQQRDFSSGCIRVKEPLELAELVLRANGDWSQERIVNTIASGKTSTVTLKASMPVHILYWTAVTDDDGDGVRLITDIYDRDRRVFEELTGK